MVRWLAAIALAAGMPAASLGADPEESGSSAPDPMDLGLLADLDDLELFDDLALLAAEDFVVSATRHAQPIDESPAAITVITREQILASGYTDLVDILRLVPGADVYRVTGGHVAVGLRSRTTHGGDKLLALIDGRDFAPSLFGSPNWSAMPIDVGSIERVEIIRGPASTLYGANALQGVVNIVTRKPTEERLAVEGEAYASDPLRHGANLRGHGSMDAWSWWIGLGYDYRTNRFDIESDYPDFQTYRARVLGRYRPSEGTELTAEIGGSRLDSKVHLLEIGRGHLLIDWPYLRARLRTGRTEVQMIAEYVDFQTELDFALNMPALDGDGLVLLATAPLLDQPHYSTQLVAQHDLDLFEGNRLTVGISLQATHFPAATSVRCPQVPFQDFAPEDCVPLEETEGRAGIFIQDEWRLMENLTFTGGLRLDQNTLTPQWALSPRAALVWKPAFDHALRLSYGRAFRKPTFLQARSQLMVDVNPDAPSDITSRLTHLFSAGPGNPDIRNEKVDSYEIGWRGRFLEGKLVATADLYHLRFLDSVWFEMHRTSLESGLGGSYVISDQAYMRYQNRDPSLPIYSWGGEATLSYQPTRTVDLRAIYSFDYLRETLEDPQTGELFARRVPFEPIHRAAGVLRWRPIPALMTSLDLIYVGPYEIEVPDPRSALMPRSYIPVGNHLMVNASASYRLTLGVAAFDIGMTAVNAPGLPIRDMPSIDTDDGSFGADPISRRINFFVRGQY